MPGNAEHIPLNSARACRACGYPLRGMALSASCPECGRPIEMDSLDDRDAKRGIVSVRTRLTWWDRAGVLLAIVGAAGVVLVGLAFVLLRRC